MNKLFFVTIFVSLFALVAGFIVPPTGVIHPSVLTACGILSFIGLLCQLPMLLAEKRKTTFKVGQSSVTIEDLIKDAYITKDKTRIKDSSFYDSEIVKHHSNSFKHE